MMACTLKTLFLAAAATLFLSFTSLLATSGNAIAQSAQPSATAPPPEKVQELIKLLDDPDIRAWLATKSPPPSESAEAAVDAQISGWEHAMRNHLIAMRKAFPRIPADAANAVAVVKTDINSRGFATIFALFAVLLAIGFGAEWLFKRALAGLRRRSAKLAAVPGGAANHQGLVVHLISETAPLVVFFLVSAGIFLAFEWPASAARNHPEIPGRLHCRAGGDGDCKAAPVPKRRCHAGGRECAAEADPRERYRSRFLVSAGCCFRRLLHGWLGDRQPAAGTGISDR